MKIKKKILKKKEIEINKKISFLEDKENIFEKERNENKINKERNKKLKEENLKLSLKIEELEKRINNSQNNINYVPLIGLNNIGATRFMNATLQCLSQTKELTNYFLNSNNRDRIINNNIALQNKNALQLSPIYFELIKKLWDKNSPKSISPFDL